LRIGLDGASAFFFERASSAFFSGKFAPLAPANVADKIHYD
jgi:hypothetical protein